MTFLDRTQEMAALERLWHSDAAQFFILYGRRRVGKTELLRQFCQHRRVIYFLAAQVRETDNLRAFTEAVRTAHSDPLLDTLEFAHWDTVFTYLAQVARDERLIVVLDEFQYLCDANPSLPSLLQRFWDLHGQRTRLFLVLCGSHISFMEREVLAERSPLYGRRTGQQRLLPLSFRDSALFFPHYPARDRLLAFGLLGGVPAYLARFAPGRSIRDNLIDEMLRPQGYLFDEVDFLLRTELKEPRTYASLLRAVAHGCTRLNQIAQRAQVDATTAGKYLQVLRDLELIRREVSAFERAPEKSRKGAYSIADNYVAFYFRFIQPHLSLLSSGAAETVYERFILPHLSAYMGGIFENICRQYVRFYWQECTDQPPLRVGMHQDRDFDLDVVAPLAEGGYLIGECKWWEKNVGENVLQSLQESTGRLPEHVRRNTRLALFSASGFTDALRQRVPQEDILLIGAEELLKD